MSYPIGLVETNPLSTPLPKRPIFAFLAVVAVGLAIGLVIDTRSSHSSNLGEAPEVVADLFPSGTFRLSDHLRTDGRILVLNLWASWCAPCRDEIPELSRFADEHPEVAVVGVAIRDTRASAEALITELEPTYPVGIDSTGRLRDRFPGLGVPATFVIDPAGMIRFGAEGGVGASDLEEALRGMLN